MHQLKELHTEKTTDGATDEMARGYQTSECDDQCNPSELVPTAEPSKTDKGLLKNKVCTHDQILNLYFL